MSRARAGLAATAVRGDLVPEPAPQGRLGEPARPRPSGSGAGRSRNDERHDRLGERGTRCPCSADLHRHPHSVMVVLLGPVEAGLLATHAGSRTPYPLRIRASADFQANGTSLCAVAGETLWMPGLADEYGAPDRAVDLVTRLVDRRARRDRPRSTSLSAPSGSPCSCSAAELLVCTQTGTAVELRRIGEEHLAGIPARPATRRSCRPHDAPITPGCSPAGRGRQFGQHRRRGRGRRRTGRRPTRGPREPHDRARRAVVGWTTRRNSRRRQPRRGAVLAGHRPRRPGVDKPEPAARREHIRRGRVTAGVPLEPVTEPAV